MLLCAFLTHKYCVRNALTMFIPTTSARFHRTPENGTNQDEEGFSLF